MQASFKNPTVTHQSLATKLTRNKLLFFCFAMLLAVTALSFLISNNVEAKRLSNKVELSFIEAPAANVPALPADIETSEQEPANTIEWKTETVQKGDNLTTIFKRASLSARDVYKVMSSDQHAKVLTKMLPGQTLKLGIEDGQQLTQLIYQKSPLESFQFTLESTGFKGQQNLLTPETLRTYREGHIDNSLFLAGEAAQMPHNLIMELANIFGWDIDFVFDIRKGDSFSVLYEEKFLHGEKIGTGNILAAEFTNRNNVYRAVRFVTSDGHANYYTPEGLSMRKAFLRAPLDVFRISSNFNLRRKHPIHKKIKAHRGVDYAAPRGTPVYAAGNGKVIASGYSQANGNYVFIQHGQRYVTKYLHLHKKYVRKGQTVTQRKTIGTVGSTGYATGPHLHYEFLVNGTHRNPRTVKLPQAKPIAAKEKEPFMTATRSLLTQLAAFKQRNNLTMVDQPASTFQH